MLENFRPPYDATVVARLKAADAVLIGKTNMDEFAMGGSTENSAFQIDAQPVGPRRASPAAPAAARRPAWPPAWRRCRSAPTPAARSASRPASAASTGLKPTYGRVSRYGLVAFASSLDQVGPLARTAEDAALLLEVLAGHDPRDSTSVDRAGAGLHARRSASRSQGLRLGLVREHFGAGLDAEVEAAVREAVEGLRVARRDGQRGLAAARQVRRGHLLHHRPVRGVEQPGPLRRRALRLSHRREGDGRRAGRRAQRSCDAAGEQRRRRRRSTTPLVRHVSPAAAAEGFGPEVKRRIMLGTYALSAGYYDAYYLKALKVRRLIRQDFDAAFERSRPDRRPGHDRPGLQARREGRRSAGDVPGRPVHRQREPGRHRRHRVSLRLQRKRACRSACNCKAPPFEEERLLRGAHMFQQATDWHTRRSVAADGRDDERRVTTLHHHHRPRSPRAVADADASSSAAAARSSAPPPNTQTCPVCIGMPGSLPVMNREAFELALQDGGGAQLRDRPVHQVGPQAVLLSRPAQGLSDQPVRPAVQPRRLAGDQRSEGHDSSRSGSASSAPTWKKTPARACTTKRPARPTAAST